MPRLSFKILITFTLICKCHLALGESLFDSVKQLGSDLIDKTKTIISEDDEDDKEQLNKSKDVKNPTKKEHKTRSSKQNRKDSLLSLLYIPFNPGIIFPKSGFALSYFFNHTYVLEPQYLSGGFSLKLSSLDLGNVKETLLLLPLRWYPNTNSFNFKFGVGRRTYSVEFGDELLSKYSNIPHFTALKIENYIIHLGLGNRWQFDNGITLGADWIDLYIPVSSGKSDENISQYFDNDDKANFNDAVTVLRYLPTISVVGLYLGYTF